jgi:ribonuclease P protein component
LLWSPAARSPGRAGFAIGAKALPRAVDRNRLRRMLREHIRSARPALDAYDVILRLKRAIPRAQFALAAAEAARMLATLTAEAQQA